VVIVLLIMAEKQDWPVFLQNMYMYLPNSTIRRCHRSSWPSIQLYGKGFRFRRDSKGRMANQVAAQVNDIHLVTTITFTLTRYELEEGASVVTQRCTMSLLRQDQSLPVYFGRCCQQGRSR
jgi:hypothetical protein